MKAVILAAGMGFRLGMNHPKPLTVLNNGHSIFEHQLMALSSFMDINDIHIVVGYKKDAFIQQFPHLNYVINDQFDRTNTATSLLLGLEALDCTDDVIWMNGDVVFDINVLEQIIHFPKSCMAVNTREVGEEEVKYRTDETGKIKVVSKEVLNAQGEALGINKITASDYHLFVSMLQKCGSQDFFEKGIELAINNGLDIYPVDVTSYFCMEIDFIEDLNYVNQAINQYDLLNLPIMKESLKKG